MGVRDHLNGVQVRALLWKDVLVRIRQPLMTIVQYLWPVLIFISLYTVRNRFQPVEIETCEFPTRQLPSKGELLPFFQSYICTIENECLRPNESFSEVSQFANAPITPLLRIVQTFLNDPTLYEAVAELPEHLDFVTTIITIATHAKFASIQEHVNSFIKLLPQVQTALGANADLSKLFSDDRMFSDTGNILCGKPFPRSDNIRFVDRMLYSEDFNGANQDELDAMPTPYCKQLYLDVTGTNNGKITWTLLKPVIQGKILYGPHSFANEKIVKNANTTFEELLQLRTFFGALNETIIKIRSDNETRADFLSLIELAQSPLVRGVIGDVGVDAIEELLNGILHDHTVLSVVQVIRNILECFSVDRFVAVQTEKDLEREAKELDDKKLFFAAIYFADLNNGNRKDVEYKVRMITDNTPITYENRNRFWFPGPDASFEFDLRYHRGFIQLQHAIDLAIIKARKNATFDDLPEEPGPAATENEDDDDFNVTFNPFELTEDNPQVDEEVKLPPTTVPAPVTEDIRKVSEAEDSDVFSMLVDRIVQSNGMNGSVDVVINGQTMSTSNDTSDAKVADQILNPVEGGEEDEPRSRRRKRQMGGLFDFLFGGGAGNKKRQIVETEQLQYYTKQFSYPKYVKDDFKTGLYLAQSVQMAFFFALIVHVALATRHRIWMKESGNSSLMRAMGLRPFAEHCSWWIINMIELAFVFLMALVILYSGGILVTTGRVFIYTFLLVFGVCVLAFCYMGSTFFSSASVGSVTTVIMFLSTFLPYIVIISLGQTLSTSARFVSNLFFSTAFCNCWHYVMRLELQHKELSFTAAFEGTTADNDFKYGFLMIILDIFIYLIIGYIYERYKQADCSFYDVPMKDIDSQTGALMQNVSKYYDTDKLAVSHVSIVFRRDHITCLLGRNGAGKSTIIKMLTGQLLPSSGDIFIANNHANGINSGHVGLCPQNSILIPNLTAKEHLDLYAAIKLNNAHSEEVERILNELQLEKYERYRVQQLSGGYKRRLSIALAFLGSPNLVILDEPCSGVDTKARKNIWELIETLKNGRAVILATHYLDEAEHLSDNILIMNNGKVIAETSPHALKNELTKSFTVQGSLVKKYTDLNNELEDEIQTELLRMAPNAKFDTQGNELRILVKYAENGDRLADIVRLFERFEAEKKVRNFRIISKNLEDIFNQLNRINNPNQAISLYKHYQKHEHGSKNGVNGKYPHSNGHAKKEEDGAKAVSDAWQIVWLLLWKRWTHFKRNYRLLITIILLPALFEIVAMSFMTLRPPDEYGTALKFSRDLYPDTNQFYSYETLNNFTRTAFDRLWAESPYCNTAKNASADGLCTKWNSSETVNAWLLSTHEEYIGQRYRGVSFNDTHSVVWYNNKGYHSMPVQLNEQNSALFRSEMNDSAFSIGTVNHPLKLADKELSTSSILQQVADAGISLIILVAFSLVVAGNSIYIVNERVSGEKLQQKLCGVDVKTYWGVTFAWDFVLYLIALLLAVIIFKLYAIPVYVDKANLDGICLILFMYGFATIPAVHVFEKLFPEASIANMTIFCLNIIVALVTITTIILFDVLGESDESAAWRDFLNRLFLVLPQHALSDGLIQICTNYIKSQIFKIYYIDTYKHPVTSDLIRPNYIALFVLGLFFMAVNYLIESEVMQKYLRDRGFFRKNTKDHTDLQFVSIKSAAANSAKTANNNNGPKQNGASDPNNQQQYTLVVNGLTKSYSDSGSNALDNVSFRVNRGECFGLLGANGAGKSTLFGILSGQLKPTAGHTELIKAAGEEKYKELSYVPQTNAIDHLLTVHEVMQFYARMRRVPDVEAVIKKALHAYHLDPYKHFLVRNLSGGNRRKLSVAVACFGKTSLVLMDEPTSDMDPVTRTLVYQAINELVHEHRSVVLTSHTISEVENVCDRIGVLKSGRLISQGTPAQLRELCGNCYLVTVFYDKIESLTIERDIHREFPTTENLVSHSHSLQFVVRIATTENVASATIGTESAQADDEAPSDEDSATAISDHGLRLSEVFDKLHKFCSERNISFTVSQSLLDRAFEQLLDDEKRHSSFANAAYNQNETAT